MSFKGPYDVQFFDPYGVVVNQTVEASSFSVMENGTAIFYHDDGAVSAMASFIRIDPARDLPEPTTGKFIHPADREPDAKILKDYWDGKITHEELVSSTKSKTYLDEMSEKVMTVYKDGQPVSAITDEPIITGAYRDEPPAFSG